MGNLKSKMYNDNSVDDMDKQEVSKVCFAMAVKIVQQFKRPETDKEQVHSLIREGILTLALLLKGQLLPLKI